MIQTHFKYRLAVMILAFASPALAQEPTDPTPPRAFPVSIADYLHIADQARLSLDRLEISPNLSVDLVLERFDVLAPGARLLIASDGGERETAPPPVALFRGHARGRPDSTVFLSVSPFAVQGWIVLAQDTYLIGSGRAGDGLPALVFHPRTLPPGGFAPGRPFCATTGRLPKSAAGGGGIPEGPPGVLPRCVDLAIETDSEFTNNLFSGNTAAAGAYIATLVGAASQIFERDLNVRFKITYYRQWTAGDPWNGNDVATQLLQFQSWFRRRRCDKYRHRLRPAGAGRCRDQSRGAW